MLEKSSQLRGNDFQKPINFRESRVDLSGPWLESNRPTLCAQRMGRVESGPYGRMTLSMTWITPFDAATSVAITVALPLSTTLPLTTAILIVPP